jgi:hypothetical protein
MDLIECILGISSEGGSGMLEWHLLLMPVAVIAVPCIHLGRRAQHYN